MDLKAEAVQRKVHDSTITRCTLSTLRECSRRDWCQNSWWKKPCSCWDERSPKLAAVEPLSAGFVATVYFINQQEEQSKVRCQGELESDLKKNKKNTKGIIIIMK